jgi:transcription termination factor Rho
MPRKIKDATPLKQVPTIEPGKGERRSGLVAARGVLELHPKAYGFLRDARNDYRSTPGDPFVPSTVIEEYGLQVGDYVDGAAGPSPQSQGPRVEQVFAVDGISPEEHRTLKSFEELTPITPSDWLRLETGIQPLTTRVMDLLTPLGKGQRALIVAPPRTGKTILLQQIGHAIATNHPAIHLMVLLIDERPEEVTEMRRHIKGEVLASSLDRTVENHVRLSRLVVARCKRLAEMGRDVFLLVDSITRMARAFNKWVGNSGRTMSGGVDVKALDIPKQLFASARAFEEGGSLTIVATALIETGSRMDELIFQEFKGTGNMELVLDRRLADRRNWPAIDIGQSGTRREENLLDAETLQAVTLLRRTLSSFNPTEAMERLTDRLGRFPSNEEFTRLITGAQAIHS